MVKAQELYGCNKCGKYPITKIVDTEVDELAKEPKCDKCGGDTHFEKVREIEEEHIPISLFEHCKRESGLTDTRQITQYMNRHYGHN